MKKFNDGEILTSTLKVYPKVKFFGYSGSIYFNDSNSTGVLLNDFLYREEINVSPIPPIPVESIALEDDSLLITEDGEYILIE